MQWKHFSDVLFDYLFGEFYISFSDEETGRILETVEKNRPLDIKGMPLEIKGITRAS